MRVHPHHKPTRRAILAAPAILALAIVPGAQAAAMRHPAMKPAMKHHRHHHHHHHHAMKRHPAMKG